jgi:TPR repeat protein
MVLVSSSHNHPTLVHQIDARPVAQDLGKSLEWYRKAALQGYEMDLSRRTEI